MSSTFATWGCIAGSLVWLSSAAAMAQPAAANDCRSLAEAVEREAGLPPGLLVAIGQVETGRPNPATGRIEPWPWSTNLNGAGHYFATAAEAVAWTANQLQSGQRSIDVGCFQVNLKYHPDAFASLEEAFDPASNARYAANFLLALYRRTNNWQLAAAQYHSADPQEGAPYGSRVFALMGGAATAQGPLMTASLGTRQDRVAVRLPLFAGVQVIVPAWAMSAESASKTTAPAFGERRVAGAGRMAPVRLVAATMSVRRLPRVYTPS